MGPDPAACTRAPADGVYEPYWARMSHAAATCPEPVSTVLHVHPLALPAMGHWGSCPLLDFQLSNILVTSKPHKLCHLTPSSLSSNKYVTLKLFSLSFVPLLAPNHGDATEGCRLQMQKSCITMHGPFSRVSHPNLATSPHPGKLRQ